MQLNRLNSTTQTRSAESGERLRPVAESSVPQVAALEGVAGDRQRSLQEEINTMDPKAIGDFHGEAHILQDTRQLAAALSALGNHAEALMKPAAQATRFYAIDDEA